MKPLLYYLLQLICISAILYGYYHLALRNKKFHHYNRFYLLAATFLSITIPFFNIPLYFTAGEKDSSFVLQTLSAFSSGGSNETLEEVTVTNGGGTWFTFQHISYLLYLLVAIVMLARIIISLLKIKRIIQSNPVEKVDKINFVNTEEAGTPFSFFRWLFWNKKIELGSEKGEQIFKHEVFHIEQKHSWDIMYMETLTFLFWFNPFFHLMKKEMKTIHEFLADQFAIKENKHWEYAEMLLMQALNTHHHLVNPFFHNQIKRRIAMITTSQKPRYQYARKILVLPLAGIAVALFAFSYHNKNENEMFSQVETPVTVVIDAGHGGSDAGAYGASGIVEKNITLDIARKVMEMNKDKNLKIILSRNSDVTTAIQSRTVLAKESGADLFISIHINSSPNADKSGVQIFVADKNKAFTAENKILGSILLNYFSQCYKTDKELLQRAAKIWVLDEAPCPAALIECGFISNQDDLAYMSNSASQEQMAKAILKGIDQFFEQKNSADWEARKSSIQDSTPLQNESVKSQQRHKQIYTIRNKSNNTAIMIQADSIVYSKKTTAVNTGLGNALYIVNGVKQPSNYCEGKLIISKKMTIYDKNDQKALQLYGKEAANGVVVFESATVNPIGGKTITQITLKDSQTQPLFVIDNEIQDRKNNLELKERINPAFIEKIDVLKDTSAIQKYGEDGKYGVIEIFTKKSDTIPGKNNITIFDKVEVEPSFPGGATKWKAYLAKHLDGSIPIKNKATNGAYTVVVLFIVKTDGSISNVRSLTHHGFGMEEEAERVIKNGPRWLPAVQNGRMVNAYHKQPITFKVVNNESLSPKEVVVEGYQITEKKAEVNSTNAVPVEVREVQLSGFQRENTSNPASANNDIAEIVVQGYPIASKKITLQPEQPEMMAVIYPNPANQVANISLTAVAESSGVLSVFDMSGKMVNTKQISIATGNNMYSIDTRELTKGNYIIRIADKANHYIKSLKLIKN